MLGAAGRAVSGLVKSATKAPTALNTAVKVNIPAVAARKYFLADFVVQISWISLRKNSEHKISYVKFLRIWTVMVK